MNAGEMIDRELREMRAEMEQLRKTMKRERCEKCGRYWIVSATRPSGKMFMCPDCDDKLMFRPYRSKTGVWVSEDREGGNTNEKTYD